MAQTCTVCALPRHRRAELDNELKIGEHSYSVLAKRYDLSKAAVGRHALRHVRLLAQGEARRAAEAANGGGVDQLEVIRGRRGEILLALEDIEDAGSRRKLEGELAQLEKRERELQDQPLIEAARAKKRAEAEEKQRLRRVVELQKQNRKLVAAEAPLLERVARCAAELVSACRDVAELASQRDQVQYELQRTDRRPPGEVSPSRHWKRVEASFIQGIGGIWLGHPRDFDRPSASMWRTPLFERMGTELKKLESNQSNQRATRGEDDEQQRTEDGSGDADRDDRDDAARGEPRVVAGEGDERGVEAQPDAEG